MKARLEFRFDLRIVLLDFQLFTAKPVFRLCFCSTCNVFFVTFGYKQYGSCLCDMQISYKMASNAHVHQVTVASFPHFVSNGLEA